MILSLQWDSAFCFIPIGSNTSGFWTAKSRVKKQRVVGGTTQRHPSASTDVTLNRYLKEFSGLVSFTPRSSSYPKHSSTICTQELWSLRARQVEQTGLYLTLQGQDGLKCPGPFGVQLFKYLYWLKYEHHHPHPPGGDLNRGAGFSWDNTEQDPSCLCRGFGLPRLPPYSLCRDVVHWQRGADQV